jgi:carbon storage regulator
MLVLSRRIGEQIVIDNDIVVTVVSIKGNQVRLGFTAPTSVSICREELLAGPLHATARRPVTVSARDEIARS